MFCFAMRYAVQFSFVLSCKDYKSLNTPTRGILRYSVMICSSVSCFILFCRVLYYILCSCEHAQGFVLFCVMIYCRLLLCPFIYFKAYYKPLGISIRIYCFVLQFAMLYCSILHCAMYLISYEFKYLTQFFKHTILLLKGLQFCPRLCQQCLIFIFFTNNDLCRLITFIGF